MDILTRMRSMTPETLANVRTDFDDAPVPAYASRAPKNMVRIVEGSDDLRHPNAGQGGNDGTSESADWSDNAREARIEAQANHNGDTSVSADWSSRVDEDYPSKAQVDDYMAHHNGDTCNNPTCCPVDTRDARSVGQRNYMNNLITWITEKDAEAGKAARTWTDNVTAAGKWSYDKADKFSISSWIDRLKAKNAALNAAEKAAPRANTGDDAFQAIPNGYYAVGDAGPDDIHFFRVSRFRDGGIKVQEQASDTLHPVRRGSRRTGILNAILSVGPDKASALYGQTIGRCGRCNRTLTDAVSRARGIGPDCWGKM